MNYDTITDRLEQLEKTAVKRGADAARLTFRHSINDDCEFENGRLKNIGSGETKSYSIKTLVNGKTGIASGNSEENMEEMLERALTLAKTGSTSHFTAYPRPAKLGGVKTYSDKTAALKIETMINDCKNIIESIKEHSPDVFISAGAGKSISTGILVTSGGVRHMANSTAWSLGAYTQQTNGTDMLFTSYSRSWRDFPDFYDPALIARKNIEDLINASKTVAMPSGKHPVMLHPGVAAMFLGGVFLGVNGKNVAKGDSPLRGKLGEQVLHKSITITDDPHRDFSPGASAIDNDGVPTAKQTVFDRGVLKMFLYDLDTAGLAGTKPTGNNTCSPYAPDVAPGEQTKNKLIASVKDGLYIKQLIGFGQSNIINGDFSANVGLGYKIHNGELAGRVKNVMISGNLYNILKNEVELSAERDPITRVPYMLVEGININS